ncbi:hypothetical protein [Flammeovirga kamogawensis]|uniref:Uncharacterized protein n=1 Tax=Flammeovirga kamogawensis TaxID=373891 RepID=A0ABX8GSW5_9BACT|nr:hypothetical protein [Flammeovirga kamogawensis]MBB6463344.1 hypothetical protein [Flammeovirga kamogawensis]QWG06684.1 hypothetical protein KM029_15410 [Flammeovirga kamogawensis]TRX68506.1 hypothetical protein EO216_10405 [Flammeovirga kamogawensis]
MNVVELLDSLALDFEVLSENLDTWCTEAIVNEDYLDPHLFIKDIKVEIEDLIDKMEKRSNVSMKQSLATKLQGKLIVTIDVLQKILELSEQNYFDEDGLKVIESNLIYFKNINTSYFSDEINFERGILSSSLSNSENALAIYFYKELSDTYVGAEELKSAKLIGLYFDNKNLEKSYSRIEKNPFWKNVINNSGDIDVEEYIKNGKEYQLRIDIKTLEKILSTENFNKRYELIAEEMSLIKDKLDEKSNLLIN